MDPKITGVVISDRPSSILDPMPVITATFEDGSSGELFSFYPDEIDFTEAELIGLTMREAKELKRRKDVAYLQS